MCHVSRVPCHVSCVMGHVSSVTCHMSNVNFFLALNKIQPSGEASRWRVCYQRGQPRLVVVYLVCFGIGAYATQLHNFFWTAWVAGFGTYCSGTSTWSRRENLDVLGSNCSND